MDYNNFMFVKIDGNPQRIQKLQPQHIFPSTLLWSLFQLPFERNIRTHTSPSIIILALQI